MTSEQIDQLQQSIETACRWEASAPKPGNVHPGAAFDDLTYDDFIHAAQVAAPHLARSAELGVGPAVLEAVRATRAHCGSNVNLGICLLIAPLAAVPMEVRLNEGIALVLAGMTDNDARCVYKAIQIANPGGLGRVSEQDVSQPPTCGLMEAMQLAEDRDRIAWNYGHAFEDVLVTVPAPLKQWRGNPKRNELIVGLQLELLARVPDSLIARKCGLETAYEASRRAREILEADWPASPKSIRQIQEFDRWLRADGNHRNPGTTADLLAASLFAILRENQPLAQYLQAAEDEPSAT